MQVTLQTNSVKKADVLVIGGGTAGVFAAIAAAESGAKTVLVEKNSILGGTMTAAGVNFPGLFFAWGKQIIDGPCWRAIERTIELGGAVMPEISFRPKYHNHEQILLNRFVFAAVITDMCKAAGVEVITNAMPTAVKENEENTECLITAKSELIYITADVAIDCTGDANLVTRAGYAVEKSKIQQPATLQNRITGYNKRKVSLAAIKEKYPFSGLPARITPEKLFTYLKRGIIDIHIPCEDADTSYGKTLLEQNSLAALLEVYKFLRTVNGLKNLTVDFIAEETGVRETNRIVGERTITAEEYVRGERYPDSVCYAFYPIDLHVMNGIEQTFLKENVVAKIPYSALVPKGAGRILCAGRCISSDTYANSAVRVEAVCMATGQAAGCAAAIAAKRKINIKEVCYTELCRALENVGAIIPR